MKRAKNVDEYIAAAEKESQPKLRKVRAAIRQVAPDAVESISYGMPFYSYRGEVGFKNRLVYFGLQKSRLVLYMRPQDLEGHASELAEYKSTIACESAETSARSIAHPGLTTTEAAVARGRVRS